MNRSTLAVIVAAILLVIGLLLLRPWQGPADQSAAAQALQVLLIPADGGTESGTLADYRPLFGAVSRSTGMKFDLAVAQSYGAVVEALCNARADIAFVGPVVYLQAKERGCADLLAVAVIDGESEYYSGIFVTADNPATTLGDLKGQRMALGDVNSTTSFIYPLAMLKAAGLDPVADLKAIRVVGSHANAVAALLQGHVDAAGMSFESYDKAVREGIVEPGRLKVIARSEPVPYPPLVMNSRLSPEVQARLRAALENIGADPEISPEMIRGYGGKQVDGYDTDFPAENFDAVARTIAMVDDRMKPAILARAAER